MWNGFSETAAQAVMQLNPRTLEQALQSGFDLNAENDAGETLLHIAAKWGNPELIQRLIQAGAELNVRDPRGETPLYRAVEDKQVDNIRALLSAGADVNIAAADDTTPLFRAIYIAQVEIAMLLLEYGADVNVEAKDDGGTPLLWAVGLKDPALVRELVSRGANIHHPGVLQSAAAQGRMESLEFLLERGAQINAANRYGNTCLHIAAGRGSRELVAWLLARGADATARGEGNMTPLDHAVRAMQDDVIPLLRDSMVAAGVEPTSLYDVTMPTEPLAIELLERTRSFIRDYEAWNTRACDLSEKDQRGSGDLIRADFRSLLHGYGVSENRRAPFAYSRDCEHTLVTEVLWKAEVSGSEGRVRSRVKRTFGGVTEYEYDFSRNDHGWQLVQLWTVFGAHDKEPLILDER